MRAAQSENPDRIVLLDLDPAASGGPEAVLGAVLATGEPQLALRGTTLSVPRLARVAPVPGSPAAVFGPDSAVLISGAGTLGGLAARDLVTRHGVRRLTLASRRGPDGATMAELAAELTRQGAEVSLVACDLSDRDQVAALLAKHPPTAIVHTAGAFDAGVVQALTPDKLARVFGPKAGAARHLDELTRDLELDAFIVYSSASSIFMGAGSGGYAAANAYLDGLMACRRAAGLPGVSLAWGPWQQLTGMAGTIDDLTLARMSRREGRGGILGLRSDEGTALFDAALASGRALLVPVKLDLREVRADAASGGGVPHLLRGLVRAGRQPAQAASAGDGGLASRLAGLAPAEQEALLLDLVRRQAAVVLGHGDPAGVRADTAFKDAGFDSLTSVELRNRLREVTSLKLPATLAFDHPNPQVLARHLRAELAVGEVSPADSVLAGLAGLEPVIGSAACDDEARDRIIRRLRELLKAAQAPGDPVAAGPDRHEDLDTASDEELFALVDRSS